jgi:hypothetical protein
VNETASTSSDAFVRAKHPRTGGAAFRDRLATGIRSELSPHAFAAGVAGCSVAVATFVLFRLHAWPPHEDETLALFVGRGSLSTLLEIVLGERGGAPLHFLFAFAVAHLGGGLTALRLVSAFFAVASIPVAALLAARLTTRTIGLVTAALVSASWALLFHAVYGRMYSLFLFTSALSYLAMLVALERGGRRAFSLWGLAIVATVATHPYGALVLGSQVLYVVLTRVRAREAIRTLAIVGVVCIPFWRTDLVLAGRFDVGVGGGGDKLGGPLPVAKYLATVAGDFSSGFLFVLPVVLALAAVGAWWLARSRPSSALLVATVIGTPTLAFLVARLGSSTSPESRHLIFALPFFSMLVATGIVVLARRPWELAPLFALGGIVVLLAAEVGWGAEKTADLFGGEARTRVEGRHAASAWLAATTRPNDVLFGYDPLFLGAWEQGAHISRVVIPRADAKLARAELDDLPKPLGRGVWVLDASDTNNFERHMHIVFRLPVPHWKFDAKVFGPFLVIRSHKPTVTPAEFLSQTIAVMILGQSMWIGDADINLLTASLAAGRYSPAKARDFPGGISGRARS